MTILHGFYEGFNDYYQNINVFHQYLMDFEGFCCIFEKQWGEQNFNWTKLYRERQFPHHLFLRKYLFALTCTLVIFSYCWFHCRTKCLKVNTRHYTCNFATKMTHFLQYLSSSKFWEMLRFEFKINTNLSIAWKCESLFGVFLTNSL